jgi:hypothetical protein
VIVTFGSAFGAALVGVVLSELDFELLLHPAIANPAITTAIIKRRALTQTLLERCSPSSSPDPASRITCYHI